MLNSIGAYLLENWGVSIWLIISISLMIVLKVFSSKPLNTAPTRRSTMALHIVAGVILLQMGAFFLIAQGIGFFPLPKGTHPVVSELPAATTTATSASTKMDLQSSPQPSAPTTRMSPEEIAAKRLEIDHEIHNNAVLAASEAIATLLILFLIPRCVEGGFAGWGLTFRRLHLGVLLGVLGLLILYPILDGVEFLTFEFLKVYVHRAPEVHPTIVALTEDVTTIEQKVKLIFFAAVVAPVLEEIFFRGIVQTAFIQPRFGLRFDPTLVHAFKPSTRHRWVAIMLTSAFFAAVHTTPEFFPPLFVLALGLGYLYERTGNLWSSISLHACFNSYVLYWNMK